MMNQHIFYFEFTGREKNAIGIRSHCHQEVMANTYDEAVLKLYDTHEHISITHHIEFLDGQQVTEGGA